MMIEEKVKVINMISEGKITVDDGVHLFRSLMQLDDLLMPWSDVDIDHPYYLPPWYLAIGHPDTLMQENECEKAIATCNRKMLRVLQEGRLKDIPHYIAILDVLELADFKPARKDSQALALSYGSLCLCKEATSLTPCDLNVNTVFRLSTDIPMSPLWPMPVSSYLFPPRIPIEIPDEQESHTTIESLSDRVTVSGRTFQNCLRLRTEITDDFCRASKEGNPIGLPIRRDQIGTKTIWLAPSVGMVKLIYEHFNKTETRIELVAYQVKSKSRGYFPLELGNWWQYQWVDPISLHQERWRLLLRPKDENYVLTIANYSAQPEMEK